MTSLPTLFLDRDGVVNERIPGDYVRTPDDFVQTPGMEEAMHLLSRYFGRIVVVTNQAGIGKGLMTESDLHAVHAKMFEIAASAGGRIDAAFYCPHTNEAGCRCRKPATGMAWLALAAFPDIDFENAWLAGDSASDMAFGQSLGMRTALISGKMEDADKLIKMRISHRFDSLLHFAKYMVR